MKKVIGPFLAAAAVCSLLAAPIALAQEFQGFQSGGTSGIGSMLTDTDSATGKLKTKIDGPGAPAGFIEVVANVINVLLGFLGLILVAFIIYAGFLWMTDSGKEEQVKKAKTILRNSIIGVLIIVTAYVIMNFVINTLAEQVISAQ